MKVLALATLLLVSSGCATARRQAQATNCLNLVKMLAIACHNYASAYGTLPPTLDKVAPFTDPSLDLSAYDLGYTGKVQDCPTPGSTVLVRQRQPPATGQIAVAYVDGSAELLDPH